MAGDWIKMRLDLADDPAVIVIAAELKLDPFAVVGRLHGLWSWADRQTRDGNISGVTSAWIDAKLRARGFAAAMQKVGWLGCTEEGLTLPKFDQHNGSNAKTRAMGSKRQQAHRKNAPSHVGPDAQGEGRRPRRAEKINLDTWTGVLEAGARLSMPYSNKELGTSYTTDVENAHRQAYRKKVEAEYRRRFGKPDDIAPMDGAGLGANHAAAPLAGPSGSGLSGCESSADSR